MLPISSQSLYKGRGGWKNVILILSRVSEFFICVKEINFISKLKATDFSKMMYTKKIFFP